MITVFTVVFVAAVVFVLVLPLAEFRGVPNIHVSDIDILTTQLIEYGIGIIDWLSGHIVS